MGIGCCASTCVPPRAWTGGFSDSWSTYNLLIQNFSFKHEITPWRIFTKGKKAQKFSSLHASLHRDRGFNVWKITIFVGFICSAWELGYRTRFNRCCLISTNCPKLWLYCHIRVCVCAFLFKQYIRVAQLLRFWKSTLFDAELDTLMPCVKIPVTLKYEHSTEG